MEQHANHVTEVLTDPRLLSAPAGVVGLDWMHISIPDFIMYGTAILIAIQLGSWIYRGYRVTLRFITKTRRSSDVEGNSTNFTDSDDSHRS